MWRRRPAVLTHRNMWSLRHLTVYLGVVRSSGALQKRCARDSRESSRTHHREITAREAGPRARGPPQPDRRARQLIVAGAEQAQNSTVRVKKRSLWSLNLGTLHIGILES